MSVPRGLLASEDPGVVEQLAAIVRVIAESPSLLAREQQIYARYTPSLAALLPRRAVHTRTTSGRGSLPTH